MLDLVGFSFFFFMVVRPPGGMQTGAWLAAGVCMGERVCVCVCVCVSVSARARACVCVSERTSAY